MLRDGLVTKIDDIVIPPTIVTIVEGSNVVLRGTAPPASTVMVEGFSDTQRHLGTTTADEWGNYRVAFDLPGVIVDSIEWQVRTVHDGVVGESGKVSIDAHHDSSVAPQTNRCVEKGDTNGDCVVNTLDLMIQLQQPVSINPVSLRPFSLMAYYWTG